MLALVLVAALAHAAPSLTAAVHPTHMAIALDVDPAAETFRGTVSIELAFETPLTSFTLHARELELETVEIVRQKKRVRLEVHRVDDALVELRSPRTLDGEWTLEIAYTGHIHEQPYGLYRYDVDDQPFLVTQLEDDDARSVWPCFDEPHLKVSHQFTITTTAGLAVITNGAETSARTRRGRTTHTFAATLPIPTYGAAVAIGDYVPTPVATSVPTTVWSARGEEGDLTILSDEIRAALPALEKWFDIPYPYGKLDWIVVPSFNLAGMENPGAVVMSAELLPPPGHATVRDRHDLSMLVAHELTHMWFGDLVTMVWWDDIWLNEAFAEWLGNRIGDARYRELLPEARNVRTLYAMLQREGVPSMRALRAPIDPDHVFETTNYDAVYEKGPALLDATVALLGEDAFRKALHGYIAEHANGNATAQDLFRALSTGSGKDVGAFLGPYLDQAGAPRIAVTGTPRAITVRQSRFWLRPATSSPETWPVSVRFRVGHRDGTTTIVPVWLDGPSTSATFDDAVWVMPQADGIGYYTFALDPRLSKALLAHRAALTVPERLAFIHALELEAASGRRTAEQQLELVDAFRDERDTAIQYDLAEIVDRTRDVKFAHDAKLDKRADAYVWSRLGPWLDAIGYEPRDGETAETEDLRQRLLQFLAQSEYEPVMAYARELLDKALADPLSIPDAARLEWALLNGGRRADRATYDRLLALADQTSVRSVRSALLEGAASIRAVREAALTRALDAATPFEDMWMFLEGAFDSPEPWDDAKLDRDVDWVLANTPTLLERLAPADRVYLVDLPSTGCNVARAKRIAAYFQDPARRTPGFDLEVDEMMDAAQACADRLVVDLPSLRHYLSTHATPQQR
jgi:cytosol alanyl aminopeptidase